MKHDWLLKFQLASSALSNYSRQDKRETGWKSKGARREIIRRQRLSRPFFGYLQLYPELRFLPNFDEPHAVSSKLSDISPEAISLCAGCIIFGPAAAATVPPHSFDWPWRHLPNGNCGSIVGKNKAREAHNNVMEFRCCGISDRGFLDSPKPAAELYRPLLNYLSRPTDSSKIVCRSIGRRRNYFYFERFLKISTRTQEGRIFFNTCVYYGNQLNW